MTYRIVYWFTPAAAKNLSLAAGFIKGINEVEDMLKYNIAQARLNERGNYGACEAPALTKNDNRAAYR